MGRVGLRSKAEGQECVVNHNDREATQVMHVGLALQGPALHEPTQCPSDVKMGTTGALQSQKAIDCPSSLAQSLTLAANGLQSAEEVIDESSLRFWIFRAQSQQCFQAVDHAAIIIAGRIGQSRVESPWWH